MPLTTAKVLLTETKGPKTSPSHGKCPWLGLGMWRPFGPVWPWGTAGFEFWIGWNAVT